MNKVIARVLLFFGIGLFISSAQAGTFDLGLSYGVFSNSELAVSPIRENTWGVYGTYNWKRLSFSYNFNFYENVDSDGATSEVQKKYYDSLLWADYHFFKLKSVSLFLGVGGGAYIEKTTVSSLGFMSQTEKGTSSPLWLIGTSAGVNVSIWQWIRGGLSYQIKHRINEQTLSRGLSLFLLFEVY